MKLEAMKRQAGRPTKENAGQLGPHLDNRRSNEIVAEQTGESVKQLQRYIRLTELIPELLDMADEKKIAFNSAVELSCLQKLEQMELLNSIAKHKATPSLLQAQQLKKYSQNGELTIDVIDAIMSTEKKALEKITLTGYQLKKYFPHTYTTKQMEDIIIKLLEAWREQRDV